MKPFAVLAGSLYILLFKTTTLFCQEAIPASGGNHSGSGGSVSLTIGQVMNHANQGINGTVAEGVQQPWEISTITGFADSIQSYPVITVFPNPVSGELTLQIDDLSNYKLIYKIVDSSGKILDKQRVRETVTLIPMSCLPSGIYFLYLNENQKAIKIFKIIKNNRQ